MRSSGRMEEDVRGNAGRGARAGHREWEGGSEPPAWIVSRRTVTPEGVREAAVLLDGERIAEVTAPAAVPHDAVVHDVGDLVLMPGLVDCHVHLNEPGRTEWEGFETGSRAAAAGGVTTLVDMPLNCIPVTTTVAALEAKLEATEGKLHVDVGFWGGVVPGNARELAPLARAGALGAKAFLCHSGIDDFPRANDAVLREAMTRMAEAGIPLLAHAELELPTDQTEADTSRYASWHSSRPRAWEDAAISLLIDLCRETRCPVHVVHLSSSTALPMIAAAKSEGLPLTVETCPHYLCLKAEDVPDGETSFKCAPPIRGELNRERLWAGLLEGTIDFVVTDHSPCTPQLKEGGFLEAWGGVASLSLGLPSVWSEASRRGADLTHLTRWLCAGPARFAGLSDRKGAIAPGMHADLVVWDPNATFQVTKSELRFRHPISPYLGRTLRGVVRESWLRGRRIYDGREVAPPGGAPLLHRHDDD
jgi:allantoinase